jgi:hypothetical protein
VTQVPASSHAAAGAAGGDLAGTFPSPTVIKANLPGYEWDYAQITANANVTDTVEATGTALITSNAVVYDGAPVLLEFFAVSVSSPNNAVGDQVFIGLFEGATQLARIGRVVCAVAGVNGKATVLARYRFTPTAGTHAYLITGFVNTVVGTPAIFASVGGVATNAPAYIRITKV